MSGPLVLQGTAALMAALDPKRLAKELQTGLKRAAMIVTRAAKQNATGAVLKRRTGDLGTSVHADVRQGEAEIGTKLPYGPVHEFGAVIRPIPPNRWLRFQYAARGQTVTKGRTAKGQHPWVSVAQVTIPKRPWLEPAFTSNQERILTEFRDALQRSIVPPGGLA